MVDQTGPGKWAMAERHNGGPAPGAIADDWHNGRLSKWLIVDQRNGGDGGPAQWWIGAMVDRPNGRPVRWCMMLDDGAMVDPTTMAMVDQTGAMVDRRDAMVDWWCNAGSDQCNDEPDGGNGGLLQ